MCVFAKHKKQGGEKGGGGGGSWLIEVLVSLVSSFFFSKGRGWGEGGGRERFTGGPGSVQVFGFVAAMLRCPRACVCLCVCVFVAGLQLGFN